MCGFAGFITLPGRLPRDAIAIGEAMAEAVKNRGPDDEGTWADPEAGIALAHRRLAVIDLSEHGHQPMHSHDGRHVLAFNGEIYNHRELRSELDGSDAPPWRGHSDTEVLLEAIARRGMQWALERSVGMFAFASWDRKRRELTLARDRMGEKPLYYGQCGTTALFGSELDALRAHPSFDAPVDRGALSLYLRHGYVPGPLSIYESIHKLQPGCTAQIRTDHDGIHISEPTPYWSLRKSIERPGAQPLERTGPELIDQLEELLRGAIRNQMVADVPVGAFLSGGIDSSTVVALMSEIAERPVKTFTIGFAEKEFDEARFAREIATRLGTDHTEMLVSPQQAMDVVDELPAIWDEPFGDSSQIPTLLVSKLARSSVTVSLSGDGGDELFAGYNRYRLANRIWSAIQWMPLSFRRSLADGVRVIPGSAWHALRHLTSRLPLDARTRHFPADRALAMAGVLAQPDGPHLYNRMVSHWKNARDVVIGAPDIRSAYGDSTRWANTADFTTHMSYVDMLTYLPDDILVKVDRAAMAVSLETRVPLLDHRVVEFAAQLPTQWKVRNGQSKWLLRQVLHRRLPAQLFERPKSGFAIPVAEWLRGPFRGWVEALLDASRLRREGFFRPEPIRKMWEEHLSGGRSWHAYLWDVLMFQAWWERHGR